MSDSLFQPDDFARLDDTPDPLFYVEPRKVVHLDAAACAAVGDFLFDAVPPNVRGARPAQQLALALAA